MDHIMNVNHVRNTFPLGNVAFCRFPFFCMICFVKPKIFHKLGRRKVLKSMVHHWKNSSNLHKVSISLKWKLLSRKVQNRWCTGTLCTITTPPLICKYDEFLHKHIQWPICNIIKKRPWFFTVVKTISYHKIYNVLF